MAEKYVMNLSIYRAVRQVAVRVAVTALSLDAAVQ